MRIISGVAKGRGLISPPDERVRPTSDRAREALFSSLDSEFAGLEGIRFLDLFAGSGAVAAEALSRGAAFISAIEIDRTAYQIARENIEMVHQYIPSSAIEIHQSSVENFLISKSDKQFDVIFLDPPYSLNDENVSEILTALLKNHYLGESSLIALERQSRGRGFTWPPGLVEVKSKRYGHAKLYFGELDRVKL